MESLKLQPLDTLLSELAQLRRDSGPFARKLLSVDCEAGDPELAWGGMFNPSCLPPSPNPSAISKPTAP